MASVYDHYLLAILFNSLFPPLPITHRDACETGIVLVTLSASTPTNSPHLSSTSVRQTPLHSHVVSYVAV